MYSEFIININKIHQYEEVGDINYGVPKLQTGNNLQTIKSGRQFPSMQKMRNHNLSTNLRGEKRKMENLIPPIIFTFLVGGVAGYIAGKLVKRATGMALTIGLIAFAIIALAYTGSFNVNLDAITTNISNVISIIAPLGLTALVSSVPFVASFIAGLFIGYRRY
jgi:uncharacterized membrane protein (Fun14 family)